MQPLKLDQIKASVSARPQAGAHPAGYLQVVAVKDRPQETVAGGRWREGRAAQGELAARDAPLRAHDKDANVPRLVAYRIRHVPHHTVMAETCLTHGYALLHSGAKADSTKGRRASAYVARF